MSDFWVKCSHCDKPLVCSENLQKLKWIIGGSVAGCGLLGAAALPLFGFGAGGVSAGSFAAAWQSSIGSVAAGSLFATLQSLGATGLGVIMFGGAGAALGLLASVAPLLGWCNSKFLKVETISKSCEEHCTASFELTVNNIKHLRTLQSPELDLKGTKCCLKVFKDDSNYLCISLSGNQSCRKRMKVKIESKLAWRSIEKEKTQCIDKDKDLCIDEFVLLSDLYNTQNGFIQKDEDPIRIQVDITDGLFLENQRTKLKCMICSNDIENQELSSVQCGHIFCTKCIENSLFYRKVCPTCLEPAALKELRRVILPTYIEFAGTLKVSKLSPTKLKKI